MCGTVQSGQADGGERQFEMNSFFDRGPGPDGYVWRRTDRSGKRADSGQTIADPGARTLRPI